MKPEQAHEIRNATSALWTYLWCLQRKTRLTNTQLTYVGYCQRELVRIGKAIGMSGMEHKESMMLDRSIDSRRKLGIAGLLLLAALAGLFAIFSQGCTKNTASDGTVSYEPAPWVWPVVVSSIKIMGDLSGDAVAAATILNASGEVDSATLTKIQLGAGVGKILSDRVVDAFGAYANSPSKETEQAFHMAQYQLEEQRKQIEALKAQLDSLQVKQMKGDAA